MADSDTNMVLDRANAEAVRMMVAQLSDADVIKVYEVSEGEGPMADLAAAQMDQRHLDY